MGCSKQRQTNESLALIAYFLGRIHTAAAAVSQTSEPSDSLASRTAVGAQQAIAHTPNCSACTFAWWVLPRAECSSIYIHTSKRSRGTLAKLSSIIACCYECSRLCRQCPRLCVCIPHDCRDLPVGWGSPPGAPWPQPAVDAGAWSAGPPWCSRLRGHVIGVSP